MATVATAPSSAPGRIPFRLRIGVTGHRELQDRAALEGAVGEALDRIRDALPASSRTTVLFEAVSPLGEGADQLVASKILERPGAALEVPLPIAPKRYLLDFQTEDGKRAFWRLLSLATASGIVSEQRHPDLAYRDVGHYVADSSDVLIALWDGLRARGTGGTAEIHEWAESQRTPMISISVDPPYRISPSRLADLARRIRDTDRYNRARVKRLEARSGSDRTRWIDRAVESGLPRASVETLTRWISPHFARADALANRYRAWFTWLGTSLFLVAAAAVATIGAQIAFHLTPGWAWLEAALMFGAMLTWGGLQAIMRPRVHYRFLAERFRAGLFLSAAGEDPATRLEPHPEAATSGAWLARALREVWRMHPTERLDLPLPGVKRFLTEHWLDPQIAYYERRGRWHHRRHRIQGGVLLVLFAATLSAAIVHAGSWAEHWERWLEFLAVALPALAVAVGGIAAMRQDVRNMERFQGMVHRLRPLRDAIADAPDAGAVRKLARRADLEMQRETGEWIDLTRFREVDIPV